MKLRDDDVAFLDGYLSAFDDLPDGAWQAACEDAIGSCDKFKGKDAYEVWIAWVKAKETSS